MQFGSHRADEKSLEIVALRFIYCVKPMDRPKVVPFRLRPPPPPVPPVATDDLSQLALAAGANGALLGELVRRLEQEPRLRSLARRLAGELDWHGAEDLMQLTLERVVRGIGSYRGTGDLLGWVSRIMRNAQIECARKEASEDAKLGEYATHAEGFTNGDDAFERLGDQELRERVLKIWHDRRTDRDVQILWDRLYIGMTVEQIMRRSGHPRSTVYYMLKKGATKFLRDWRSLLGKS